MIPLDRIGGHVLAVAALTLALDVRVHLHACNIGNIEVISKQYQRLPICLDANRQMTKSPKATGHPPLCIVDPQRGWREAAQLDGEHQAS